MLTTTCGPRGLVGFVLLTACGGCQTWQSTGGIVSDLTATKDERQIVRLAKDDPFPSPSEVGLKHVEE